MYWDAIYQVLVQRLWRLIRESDKKGVVRMKEELGDLLNRLAGREIRAGYAWLYM